MTEADFCLGKLLLVDPSIFKIKFLWAYSKLLGFFKCIISLKT